MPVRMPALLLLGISLVAQSNSRTRTEWNQPVPPFRIIGNIYYVGAAGVASYLITTSGGSVLLDGGLPETAPLIKKNIATLGFRMRDVKYLLNSHAHFDHAGGLAELQRLSGARIVASTPDAPTLERGIQFPSVNIDRRIGDGEKLELGGVTLTAVLTPGHTKGCTTWTMPVMEKGKTYRVVFYCSTSVIDRLVGNRDYPGIVSDYERSFARLKTIPCDVFLAPHPSFFHLEEKRARMKQGGPNPFIDPNEMHAHVVESERAFQEALKQPSR